MKLIVPNEIRYGLQERYDTYTKKLGFMMYANKPNGGYGQQVSFDSWRDKRIEPKDISNNYQLGFVLNKGHLNKYHFGASAKFRVFHPEGFEFEISLENLSLVMDNSIISYGEIQVPCCIAWDGSNVYLLPKIDLSDKFTVETFDVHQNKKKAAQRMEKINTSGKPLPVRSLVSGRIVEDTQGKRFMVCAPTKSNFQREEIIPMFVKKNQYGFGIECGFGQGYHATYQPDFPKMYYPLTDTDGTIETGKENTFIKFVEESELTENELKNKESLKTESFLQFSPKQNFIPLGNTEKEIEDFINSLDARFKDVKFADYNNSDGKVLILDEMVKIKDRFYHIVLGNNYRLGYGHYILEKQMKDVHEKMNAENRKSYSYNRERNYGIHLIPFTSDKNGYNGVNRRQNDLIHINAIFKTEKTPESFVPLIDEHRKILRTSLMEMFETLTQEEIDNQKRIYREE